MSKQALGYLLKDLTEKVAKEGSRMKTEDPTKYFKTKTLYSSTHLIDFRATSITEQLTDELRQKDPQALAALTRDQIKEAAYALRKSLLAQVTPGEIIGNGSFLKQNTYTTLQKKLAIANEAAMNVLNKHLSAAGSSLNSDITRGSLTQPDHFSTASEIKYARDFSTRLPDALGTVKTLRARGHLKGETAEIIEKHFSEILSYYTSGNTKAFDLTIGTIVQIRSGTTNITEGSTEVKARNQAIKKALEAAIKDNSWPEQGGSDSVKDLVFKTINNAVVATGGSGKKQKIDKSPNSVQKSETTRSKIKSTRAVMSLEASTPQGSKYSLQNIVNYINSRLPEAIRANMGPGSLVNRTGNFSNSAKIVNVTTTPQGFPSLGYTYQRSPYDVFDPVLGREPWNKPGRDPRKLIETSVRDIAKDLAIGRFYLRRA